MNYTGNFGFVEEIYPDVFEYLVNAEKSAKLDVGGAGISLRNAFETWCNEHISRNPQLQIERTENLDTKIKALSDRFPASIRTNYYYLNKKGKKQRKPGLVLWRQFCNECAHTNKIDDPSYPQAVYSNLLVLLSMIYSVFKEDYLKITGREVSGNKKFKEQFMPIGSNMIIQPSEPADESKSGCLKEYLAEGVNEKTNVTTFSIIREYRKDIIESQLRGYEAPFMANSYMGIFNNVQISLLPDDEHWKQNETCYIVYTFMKKPVRLGNGFFINNSISLEQAKDITLRIAEILASFHSVEPPIYHRNLSFDSICVCQQGNGSYEPSVIKFDYAKIAYSSNTVIEFVDDVRNTGQSRILKYRAPEIQKYFEDKANGEPSWEKTDVFSLGMLAGELLRRNISDSMPTKDELLKNGVPESVANTVEAMLSEEPENRPEIQELIETLKSWQ